MGLFDRFRKPKDAEAQGFVIGVCYAELKKGEETKYEKLITIEVDRPDIVMTVHQARIIKEKLEEAIAHVEVLPDTPQEALETHGGPVYKTVDLFPDGSGTAPKEKN